MLIEVEVEAELGNIDSYWYQYWNHYLIVYYTNTDAKYLFVW